MLSGDANRRDMMDIKEWSKIIKTTSRCGLGQMSYNSLNDAIEKFPEIFGKYMADESACKTSFNLERATAEYDQIINEITTDYE